MNTRSLLFAALAAALVVGCHKPELPKITPRAAKVTNVSLQGVDLEATLTAYNPNDIDLSIKSVSAKVTLDHKYDVGTFTENKPVTLPAKKKTEVKLPIKVRWADVMGLAELAQSGRDVDYTIDGSAELGGELVRVNVPFTVNGKVTHRQMQQAAGKMMPKLPF